MSRSRPFAAIWLAALFSAVGVIAMASAFAFETPSVPSISDADAPTERSAVAGADAAVDELFAAELRPELASGSGPSTLLTPRSIGEFVSPVEVLTRPGDARTFVVEQIGRIVTDDGAIVLDITDRVVAEQERGLLGAAYHPSQPLLYAHYTDSLGDTVIAEYPVAGDGVADANAERVILTADQPYDNHNGGEITFGPDGYLYIGLGDGGLANDPDRAALDLTSPFGKILRIDPTFGSDDSAFTVPVDNPFVDVADADPTIWSYGLRNPWKFSFDPATGDLWIADVGQDLWEEINRAPASDGVDSGKGVSFGWSAFEGDLRFNDDQPADGHMAPLVTYERADGNCSISGGAVYRGQALADLIDGWYVYGDFCTGLVWGFATDAGPGDTETIQIAQVDALAAIATGGDGELYAVSIIGEVFRLEV